MFAPLARITGRIVAHASLEPAPSWRRRFRTVPAWLKFVIFWGVVLAVLCARPRTAHAQDTARSAGSSALPSASASDEDATGAEGLATEGPAIPPPRNRGPRILDERAAGPAAATEVEREAGERGAASEAATLPGEPRRQYLQLARHLQRRGAGLLRPSTDPGADDGALREQVFDVALAAAARAGLSDNPRVVLRAVGEELFSRRGLEVVAATSGGGGVLPGEALRLGRASPLTASLLVLAVAEVVRPQLGFRAAVVPGGSLIRFEEDAYVANLWMVPGEQPAISSDAQIERRLSMTSMTSRQVEADLAVRSLSHDELSARLLEELAAVATAAGRHEEAEAMLQDALELAPGEASIHVALARQLRQHGNLEGALEHVDRALEAQPGEAEYLQLRASWLVEAGEFDAARRDLSRLLEQAPGQAAVVHERLGELERRAGRWAAAIAHFRQAARAGRDADALERLEERLRDVETWRQIDALRHGETYGERFRALRHLEQGAGDLRRSSAVVEALIHTLEDPNLRLARYAWKLLRQGTGTDLELDADAWRRWWLRERRSR